MPLTNAINRLQDLRNENASNINPAKNQPINQAPKSAFKDLTNAKKDLGNSFGGKAGAFRTPQIQKKKETKAKETVHIYMDDFCTYVPKVSHTHPEVNWSALNTSKIVNTICEPMMNDCLDYEDFKDDEFELAPLEVPELPENPDEDLDFNFSMNEDPYGLPDDDFVLQPMQFDDLPEMDFTDFNFAL